MAAGDTAPRAIGVDVGTTLIKAVGYDPDGAAVATAQVATAVTGPRPAHREQDMTEVWDGVADVVRRVAADLAAAGGPVGMVAVTAQGDGCWLVDAEGDPTGPAVLWNDGRASALVEGWREAGVLETARLQGASVTFPGALNAVLAWFDAHEPERLDRSATALTCGGWVFSRLTGTVAIDRSDASVPFLDLATGSYDPGLLELVGLSGRADLLPRVLGDDERVATVTDAVAGDLGLPPGTPVVLAPYDVATTSIGCGAVEPGDACTILGTTICTEVVVADDEPADEGRGLTLALGVPGRRLRARPTSAGTDVLRWTGELMGVPDPRALADLAAGSSPGAGGVTFLPYLSPSGERVPFLEPRARGSFVGLSLDHDRADVARAVYEGLTYVIRDCLESTATTPGTLTVCGGGAANPLWLQLVADVTGCRVRRSADDQVGARGAYLIGLVATGACPDLPTAVRRHVSTAAAAEPDPARVATYDRLYARFRAVRDDLEPVWTSAPEPAAEEAR